MEGDTPTRGAGSGPRVVGAVLRRAAPYAWFLEDEVVGLRSVVRQGDVCLDVGAEYGLYTWTLAGLVGPRGHVHAVEPQAGPNRAVRGARAALRAGHVTVHRVALGAASGRGTLSTPSRGPVPVHGRAFLTQGADGLGSNAEFRRHQEVPVSVRTLDDLVAGIGPERVDFVKVDIEGGESALLDGAAATLERWTPTLMVELEDRHLSRFGATVAGVLAALAARGYAPRCWDPSRGWIPREAGDARRNVLFVHPDRD